MESAVALFMNPLPQGGGEPCSGFPAKRTCLLDRPDTRDVTFDEARGEGSPQVGCKAGGRQRKKCGISGATGRFAVAMKIDSALGNPPWSRPGAPVAAPFDRLRGRVLFVASEEQRRRACRPPMP